MPPTQVSQKVLVILFLNTLSELDDPSYLRPAVSRGAEQAGSLLRIRVLSSLLSGKEAIPPTSYWSEFQNVLNTLYAQATAVAQVSDNVLMDVEVIFEDMSSNPQRHSAVSWDCVLVQEPSTEEEAAMITQQVPWAYDTIKLSPPAGASKPMKKTGDLHAHPVVALGGTFDHLHAGHRILLSMSAWIATRKVIVGMTEDTLLERKTNREVMEPLSVRTDRVRSFLELFKPNLEYDLVPITDVCGPTGWDPDIQALVVSKETLNGASIIAKTRQEKSLPPLKTFVIEVISPAASIVTSEDPSLLRETKMSSTFIRQWIVEKGQREDAGTKNNEAGAEETEKQLPGGWIESDSAQE